MVQAVLLFEAETWVLMAPMAHKLEGVHVGFLRQVAGQKTRWLGEDYWRRVVAEIMLRAAGGKPHNTYIEKSQATVTEWMAFRPVFNICAKETVYEGRGEDPGDVVEAGGI